jgi:glycine cleavage system aminomethyltransferase T
MEQVIKYSALAQKHDAMGVVWTELYGWRMPAYFTSTEEESVRVRQSVGLTDLSWMTKFDVKGSGLKTAPLLDGGAHAWILGPLHLLVTCTPAMRAGVLERISGIPSVYVTEMTSGFAQFLLAGPRACDTLRKLTSLDVTALPDLQCAQGGVAHVRAILLREDIGQLRAFHLLVGREYSESVWESIVHAGHEFELSPFGSTAWELLRR